MQYMPNTWRAHSQEIYGAVLEKTPDREWFVAVSMIEKWIEEGLSDSQIALLWNQGHAGKCSSGVNKYGVKYDSCAYARQVIAYIK